MNEEPQVHTDPDHEGEWETGCHNPVSNELALIQLTHRDVHESAEQVWRAVDQILSDAAKAGKLAGFKDRALATLAERCAPTWDLLCLRMGELDRATWRTELSMLKRGAPLPPMPPQSRTFPKEQKLDWFHFFWREFKRWRQDKG
jgi:hypothetical protein